MANPIKEDVMMRAPPENALAYEYYLKGKFYYTKYRKTLNTKYGYTSGVE